MVIYLDLWNSQEKGIQMTIPDCFILQHIKTIQKSKSAQNAKISDLRVPHPNLYPYNPYFYT